MRLSAAAINRPITTCMVFLAVMVMGIVSYTRLPIQLIPDFTFPGIGVWVRAPYSAEENLEKVTKPLEALAADLGNVKRIRTNTRDNGAWMQIEFDFGTDVQYALVDLQERIVALRDDIGDRRVVINSFPFSTADFQANFMFLSVRGKGDVETLFQTASERIEQQLKSVSGVSNVVIAGGTRPAVEVEFNNDLLAAYRLDLGNVIARVQAAASEDTFLGRLEVPGEMHYVRLNDRVRTIDELADIIVDSNGIVRLRDVADIYIGEGVDRYIHRSDGKNSIRITMEKEADQNLIELARRTRDRVDEINATLPPGVEIHIDEDWAKYVEDAIAEVRNLAGVGALLALMVPLIFFRSLRVALIVFLSVPISLIAVFNLFYAASVSINIFSILGLALGVGMLVDNSIVVVENSFRLYGEGESPRDAARLGGVEVGRGLLAATLTTVVVFVPIMFLDSEFRLIAREPILALVFPLLMSLLVALTVVPVFTWLVLQSKRRKAEKAPVFSRAVVGPYRRVLRGSMRYRGRVLFVIAIVLAFTFLESCRRVNQTAATAEANDRWLDVYFQAPPGSTLSNVNDSAVFLENRIAEHPDLERFGVYFNSGGGTLYMLLKEPQDRPSGRSYNAIRASMLDFIGEAPGVELSLTRFDIPAAPGAVNLGPQQEIELKGLDRDVIEAYAARLTDALRQHPDISGAELEDERGDPVYMAVVDREVTQLFGVTGQTITRYIGATNARGTISSLQLIDGDKRTDVSFIISGADGSTLDEIRAMSVYTTTGGTVPLGELTQFQTSQTESRIRRTNRQSSEDLIYYHDPEANLEQLTEDIRAIAATIPNPGGVVLEMTGEAQRLERRQADFLFTLIAGAILVWVVMAAVFESFWVPFTILATNPLMLIGIVWGLDFAKLPVDDMAALGVILLIGLAVNNGIVMMDRALTLQRNGYSRTRSVYQASMTRLRPIIMTYLTTVLGLLPMALIGEEGDQWRPVAVVVIGGLTSATILTLVVLPCFYLIGDDFVRWARPGFLRFLRVLFEISDAIVNILLHPMRVLRREIPLAPSLWPFVKAVFAVAIEIARTPLKLLVMLPGDLLFLLRTLLFGDSRWKEPSRLRLASRSLRADLADDVSTTFGWVWALVKWFARLLRRIVVLAWRTFTWLPRTIKRRLYGPPVAEESSIVSAEVEPPATPLPGAPPILLRNIQMIYPAEGLRGLRDRFRHTAARAEVHALHGIDLRIDNGLFGLLGPNGAGKTTLLRTIAGLQDPTRGTVRLFGLSHREAPAELAPLVGYLPQNNGLYEWMTLYQYLQFFATLMAEPLSRAKAIHSSDSPITRRLETLRALEDPQTRHDAVMEAIAAVNLAPVAHARLGGFSGGMKQRAGIARILLQSPPILLVDEPTAGLDPIERVNIRLLLSRLAQQRLVIFSTHIVEDLEQTCDRIAILDKGRLLYTGTPEHLRDLAGTTTESGTPETEPPTLEAALLAVLSKRRVVSPT